MINEIPIRVRLRDDQRDKLIDASKKLFGQSNMAGMIRIIVDEHFKRKELEERSDV